MMILGNESVCMTMFMSLLEMCHTIKKLDFWPKSSLYASLTSLHKPCLRISFCIWMPGEGSIEGIHACS